jgi:hypothetical protein
MEVAKFTPTDAELEAAEPMRACHHTVPRRHGVSDLCRR